MVLVVYSWVDVVESVVTPPWVEVVVGVDVDVVLVVTPPWVDVVVGVVLVPSRVEVVSHGVVVRVVVGVVVVSSQGVVVGVVGLWVVVGPRWVVVSSQSTGMVAWVAEAKAARPKRATVYFIVIVLGVEKW